MSRIHLQVNTLYLLPFLEIWLNINSILNFNQNTPRVFCVTFKFYFEEINSCLINWNMSKFQIFFPNKLYRELLQIIRTSMKSCCVWTSPNSSLTFTKSFTQKFSFLMIQICWSLIVLNVIYTFSFSCMNYRLLTILYPG